MPSGWRRKTAATSSLCANATFARKIGSRKFSLSAATIRGWCASYRPWSPARPTSRGTTNRPARRTCVRMRASAFTTTSISSTKILGLGYVRVPTWLPCRLQIYFNGHSWLASRLRQRDIDFRLIANAFVEIADWQRAQHIANGLEIKRLHRRLDEMAHRFCPIYRDFGVAYHWSVDQCEYATDTVFCQQADLAAIYGNLTRTAIHTVKPDNIATFLGRKLNVEYQGELGNRFTWGVSCQGLCLHPVWFSAVLEIGDPEADRPLEPVFCSELEGPFFVPSPTFRIPERAEGVKGPKR